MYGADALFWQQDWYFFIDTDIGKLLYIWNWILAAPYREWDLVILQINAFQSFIYSFLSWKDLTDRLMKSRW